jgi:hypothetical protein
MLDELFKEQPETEDDLDADDFDDEDYPEPFDDGYPVHDRYDEESFP